MKKRIRRANGRIPISQKFRFGKGSFFASEVLVAEKDCFFKKCWRASSQIFDIHSKKK